MNQTERIIAEKFIRDGWSLLHSGWPDFFLSRKIGETTKIKVVEVKKGDDEPRDNQWEILTALAKSGIETSIVWDNGHEICLNTYFQEKYPDFNGLGIS